MLLLLCGSLHAADTAPVAEIHALVAAAETALAQNRYDEAVTLLDTAWQQAGDPRESPTARLVLNSLANLHYHTGQLELAERYFRELVALDTASNDPAALAVSLFNLGHVAASGQRYTEAAVHLQQALALSLQTADASGAAYTRKALGVNAQAQGDAAGARAYLQAALADFTRLADGTQRAAVLRNLGDIELDAGNAALAAEHYLEALPVLDADKQNLPLLRTYRGLSLALEQLQDWEQALVAQRAYTRLLQSELEQQGSDTTQRLQLELDTRRYADDNARLQLQSATQQRELAQARQVQLLQLLVLVLAVGMLALLLYMYRRSRTMAAAMHALAITDELTKLPNRRAIMDHGAREWHRTLRAGEPFSCMVLDVDHFKAVNDTFGHAAGDVVLCTLADMLRGISRQSDVVGRVGGEEFLVLAAGADARQALNLAERVRIRVELAQLDAIDKRPLTVSVGIASRTREGSLEELIQHADKALYQAKHSGRNRVVIFQPEKGRPQLTVLEGGALKP